MCRRDISEINPLEIRETISAIDETVVKKKKLHSELQSPTRVSRIEVRYSVKDIEMSNSVGFQ